MKILISGSSGFVGRRLFTYFKEKGHSVIRLKRGDPLLSNSSIIYWDPKSKKAELSLFEGFDAVIHLAGESIFGLWTSSKKEKIYKSRVLATQFLSHLLSQCKSPPKVFISASAVGFYGDQKEAILDEDSPNGEGFLANVCKKWEEASQLLEPHSRVVRTRFGVVIGEGGFLKILKKVFWLGLGGRIGSGNQWISWIAIDDLIYAFDFILKNDKIKGPINLTSPNPVRQKELVLMLKKELHRFAIFHQSEWLLKVLNRDFANDVLLASTRVFPRKLQKCGFEFKYLHLEKAIKHYVE